MRRKNPAAVSLGRRGGNARAKALEPERRREIAQQAGAARFESLTPAQRTALAKKAARARWKKKS
jgi:hypothetical protein